MHLRVDGVEWFAAGVAESAEAAVVVVVETAAVRVEADQSTHLYDGPLTASLVHRPRIHQQHYKNTTAETGKCVPWCSGGEYASS